MVFPSAQTRPSKPTLAAASVALLVVLHYLYNKKAAKAGPFGDPTKIARRIRARNDEYDFDEYDVVIVGGGTCTFV